MTPKVSVLMSVLNGEEFLRPAVQSILDQSFTDFEFIIVDNASTDATAKILDGYLDARIVRLCNDRVLSLAESLNKGLAFARGGYVARQDADDISAPDRLSRQVDFLNANTDVTLVGTHVRMIDEAGKVFAQFNPPTDPRALYDQLASENPFAHSSCMFRRAEALAVGGYPSRYVFAQDFALWLLLSQKGKLGMVGEPLLDLREHRGQTTRAPAYRVLRHVESVEILRNAQSLSGMSRDALRRGRIHLARLYGVLGRDLFLSGRYMSAVFALARGIMISPALYVDYIRHRFRNVGS
jgi:glycosyltransferase involved in cell wall biosynthesis